MREQRLEYDNVPMASERPLAGYRVPRGGVLLMNPEGFDGLNFLWPSFVFFSFVFSHYSSVFSLSL